MTAQTFDWIKKIDDALLQLDQKPQFALPSSLPIKAICQRLETLFARSSISIEHQDKGWQKPSALFQGLGDNLSVLAIEWTPLDSELYFLLSEQDLKELMGDLLGGKEVATPFFDPALSEGFLNYLAIELLQVLEATRYLAPLSPRIGHAPLDIHEQLKQSNCFVSDVSLNLGNKHIWGRLLVPEEFRSKLNKQMANLSHLEMTPDQAAKIEVDLKFEMGESSIALSEWKRVAPGDFIVLDRCSFNPDESKGNLTVKLGDDPIFRGKLKQGNIKLLEYPLYEEVKMEEDPQVDPEDMPAPDILTDGGMDLDSPSGGFVSEANYDVDSLPVHLSVEVGRKRLSVKDLRELAPGNTLDLGITPEQGVDLLVNGKRVGRGELIRMGDTLGVRILSL
ncbi:MAG: hypothetical protein S4CHLAM81_14760 [Chlamydiales bacterium]|nr:hypothetical protein [Chlamydiales bacterium]MCH9636245.1 hypothetical protein [Chlamydiales bacterium]MCH9704415.1 type III secretion system cytoplasmic ring protein SctQ [Chlamydiota bacterium]